MVLDLSLTNLELYADCHITEVGGRLNLITPVHHAVNVVGRNVQRILDTIPPEDRQQIVLTGPMAVWAYLVVFHAVVHRFGCVSYDDGRGRQVTIAAHGPYCDTEEQA